MADPPEGASPGQVAALAAAAVDAADRARRGAGRGELRDRAEPGLPRQGVHRQRQQVDQLLAQQQTLSAQVQALQQQDTKLTQTWYIEEQARAQLHMCFPDEQCYEVISGSRRGRRPAAAGGVRPLYDELLQSVAQHADAKPGK